MTIDQWNLIKHFSPDENWGDPSKIEFALVFLLDSFRNHIDRPIIVTSGTGGKHLPGSKHYEGIAVDIVIDSRGYDKLDLILAALRFPFMGLGVYPKWKSSTLKKSLGLHLDIRASNSRSLWIGVNEPDGFKQYALNGVNLKHFGIL